MSANPVFFAGDDERAFAAKIKSSIQNWIESARPDISTSDLATIYSTSVAAHRAGNLRAKVMSRVVFKAKKPDGNYLPPNDPLMQRINAGSRDRMERSELTHFAWGRNLIYKERSVINPKAIIDLQWMNPYIWEAEVDFWDGLRRFNIYRVTKRGPSRKPVRHIELRNAIHSHYIDFKDDYDGVAPLEVAFMHATMDSGLAEVGVSLLRNMAVPMGMVVPDYEAAQKAGTIAPAKPGPGEIDKITDFFRRTVQGIRNYGRVIVSPNSWKFIQLQADLDKMALKDTSELTERRVYAAADIPYGLVSPEESNYAQAYVTRLGWFDFSIKPMAEWYAEIYTEQLAHDYHPEVTLEPDYSRLDFLF